MKRKLLIFLLICCTLFNLIGCSEVQTENPGEVTVNFLNALQDQNYTHAKSYYAENFDNIANFRNKVEAISPSLATEVFNKIADFDYTIKKIGLTEDNPLKAVASVSLVTYNLGTIFEEVLLDYLKTDLEMTLDGGTDEELTLKAEEMLLKDLENLQKTFRVNTEIHLTQVDGIWKIDKLSSNPDLINALTGNIIGTITRLQEGLTT